MPEQSSSASARDYSNLYVPAAIIIAGVIIGAFVMVGLSRMGGAQLGPGGQPVVAVDIEDVDIDGHPYIGREDAPVVLAYWSDYQCPFCKAVEMGHPQIPTEPSIPALITEYVDTGKLRIVFKDYAFLSEDSTTAALWGRAVWELFPNSYWAWREAMYDAQDEEHGGFGNEETIYALTKTIAGIDADAVRAKVASDGQRYVQLVDADKAEGTGFGIQGTPGFITGTTLIPGAYPLSEFRAAIDAQL